MKSFVKASYPCAECGREAGSLTLFVSTAPPIEFRSKALKSFGTLVATGATGPITYSVSEERFEAMSSLLERVVNGDDPVACAQDTGSFCRHCQTCYCKDHWQLNEQFTDFYDGDLSSLDAIYGQCPKGHSVLLSD